MMWALKTRKELIMIQVKRIKKKNFYYVLFFVLIGLCFLCLSPQEDPIASGEITVMGVSLKIDPPQQTVPVNTETAVNTVFAVDNPGALEGMVVKGTLRGPSINGSITLTTLPNHPFAIPGFPIKGTYTLEDIHLERDGKSLIEAEPGNAVIDVMDIILTEVKTRPLTMDEIREKGIVISDENFSAYNFSVGFMVKSEVVTYEFPVFYSGNKVYIPPTDSHVNIGTIDLGRESALAPKSTVAFDVRLPGLKVDEIPGAQGGEDSGPTVSGVVIINNDIAFLNQFFSVMFIISNSAPEDSQLTLKDLTAGITFPDGLREAETNPPHVAGTAIPVRCPGPDGKIGTSDDLDIILATFSGMAEFLAEGLDEGTHIVTIDFEGTLSGLPSGDTPVQGSASGAVIVKNPAFSITFAHPSVIRKGEEYDIHVSMTNISPVDANLVSLTMPATRLIGTSLLSDETISFEIIASGESKTAVYHMMAKETGKITASAFAAEGNVSGKFVLTAGVGEQGIPLSPDTLELDDWAYMLPDDLVNAALMLLGEAYCIATTPPGGLPEGLPYIGRVLVQKRALDFSEAGQHLDYGDSLVNTVERLTLNWLGNRLQDINFDILRRLTSKGIKLAQEQSNIFNEQLKTTNAADFQMSFAETCAFKNPFLSALLSFGGGTRCANLTVTDYYRNRLSYDGNELTRDIPYGELYLMEDGSQRPVDFALIGSLDENGYSHNIEIKGESEGTFDLALIVPDVNDGFRQVVFTGISCVSGSVSTLSVNKTDEMFTLSTDLDGDGTVDARVTGDITPVQEPALQLLGATQNCSADPAGHATALFFNRPVDRDSAEAKVNYYIEGKEIYAAFPQPSGRIVLVGTNNPISPFVESRVRVENVKDTSGGVITPSPVEMPIRATIKTPGGIVYGQVFAPDGQPVPETRIYLVENDGYKVNHCYARTDSSGVYQFDFVRILKNSFTIKVKNPATGRMEQVKNRIMTNGQRLKMDIYLRGLGSIKGKVVNTDGSAAPNAVVVAKVENSGIFEYYQAETEKNGEFIISDLPIGRVELSAYSENMYGESGTTISAPGQVQEVEITVVGVSTASASGRVLESDGVTPVSGTYVNFFGSYNFGTYTQTDKNGYFQFPTVPVGTFRIEAYNPLTGKIGGQASGQLIEGQNFSATIIFRGFGRISGKVKNQDGTPMPGILVYMPGTNFYMDTDSNGAFDFQDVPMGRYTITAYNRTTQATARGSVKLITEGQEAYTILVFSAAGTGGIFGTVYNSDGITPAPYASVDICDRNFIVRATTETDASGNFQVDGLPLDSYLVAAQGSDGDGAANKSIQFPGQLAQCNVTLLGKGKVIINVFAQDGQTGIMAEVNLRRLRFKKDPGSFIGFIGVEETHQTDENGHVEVDNVYMGNIFVSASNPFYPRGANYSGELTTSGQELTVNLVMLPTGKVRVKVVNYDGVTIVPGAALLFSTSTYSITDPVTADENGEYEFTLVPPGYFSVTAEDTLNELKGQLSGSMGKEGETVEVTVRLLGKGQVSGTVKNESDVVVPDAEVTLRNLGFPNETFDPYTTGSDGRFTFYQVSEGPFSLFVKGSNNWSGGTARGEVPAHNSEVELDVCVTTVPHGIVSGRVLSPDLSSEMTGTEVVLTHSRFLGSDGSWQTIGYFYVTGEGGFRFEDIPEGSFKLEVVHPASGRKGKAYGSLDTQGENVVIDIPLEGRGTVTGTFFDGSQTIPIANASIKIKSKGAYPFELVSSTNSEGHFTFQQVGVGPFDLEATETSLGLIGMASGEVEYDQQTVYINIYDQGSGTVKGTVFEADGTTPSPDARIRLTSGNKSDTAYADASGNYQVENVPVGSFSLKAFEQPDERDFGTASGTIEFHGQEAVVNILFQGLGTVTGRVLDGNGNPVSDYSVILRSGYETSTNTSGHTGNPGEFRFENTRMGVFGIEAKDPGDPVNGLSGTGNGELTFDGQVVAVDLTLESAGSVTGRVLMPDGTTPAENAYITLKGSNFTKYGTADASGNFRFDAVKLGSFSLEIQGAGSSGKARVYRQIQSPGYTVNFGDIPLDNVIPEVTDVSPANGSSLVPLNTAVTVYFSEAMSASRITTSTVKLTSNWGTTSGSLVLSPGEKSVVLTPSAPLRSFVIYTLVVDGAVEDAAGNTLGTAFTSSFTTSDIEPPVVVSMVPANNASGIQTDAVITVFFNEPVDPSQFGAGNMQVTKGGAAVTGTIGFAEGNASVVFTPAALVTDSVYSVFVQQAVDFAGNVQAAAFSAVFSTIDTIAPTLQLNPPAGGTTVIEGSSVQVSADTGTAADISAVHFFINGQLTYTDSAAPYNFSFNAPLISQGGSTFLVEAYAVDHEGNRSTRENLTFTLLTDMPPQVTLTGPSGTTVYPGAAISCSVSASDDIALTGVTVTAVGGTLNYSDTQTVSQSTFSSNYTIDVPSDILPGTEIVLHAEAEDNRGNTASGDDITIHIPQDEQNPVVNITSPSEGALFKHNEVVNIEAEASDDVGIKEVRIYLDDQLLATLTQAPYTASYTVPPLEEEKPSVVKVEVEDLSTKVSEDTVNIVLEQLIDIDAPKVKILSPSDGSLVYAEENLKIKVEASDDEGVERVEIYVDDQLIHTDAEEPYETVYTIPVDASPGSTITFKAVATDVGDKSTTDQAIVEVVTGTVLPDGTVIETDDTNYDNQTIIIHEGTVTITGSHTFTHVLVKESGILTHRGATTAEVYEMELTLTGKLVIGIDAAGDVSMRGYLGGYQGDNNSEYGRTLGNTTTGGSENFSGGSYGGYGGQYYSNPLNEPYGSLYDPTDPGSGGGGYNTYDRGGNGGGIIRINAAALVLDGSIMSNGGNSNPYAGGGSGGSICIHTTALSGTGLIRANGGPANQRGSGSGGRVAIYYQNAADFDLSRVTAFGGKTVNGTNPKHNGSAGTVYLEKEAEPGQIIIKNNGIETEKGAPLTAAAPGTITALTGTILTDGNADFAPNTLVGMLLQPNIENPKTFTIISNTSTEIEVETTDVLLTGVAQVDDHYRVKHSARLLLEDGISHISGSVSIPVVTLVNSTFIIDGTLTVDGQLSLQSGSLLTHSSATIGTTYSLHVAAEEVIIDESSSIDVTARGYLGGYEGDNNSPWGRTYGNVTTDGSKNFSGGSFGGYGGQYYSNPLNKPYGSPYDPTDPGSGGGGYNTNDHGGNGGGVIRVNAAELVLDGSILSNGGNSNPYSGGGSGGSICIHTAALSGIGLIKANGGEANERGSGSGGRVAIYYQNAADFDLSRVTAFGGKTVNGTNPKHNGSAGTIYLEKEGEEAQLIINNRSQESNKPLIFPVIEPAEITSVSGSVLQNTNANYMPASLIGMKLIPNINNPGNTFAIIDNDRTTITVDGDLSGAASGDIYSGIMVLDGNLKIIDTAAEISRDVELGNLTLSGSSSLSHPGATISTYGYLNITANNVTIESGCSIDVSDRGYLGGHRGDNDSHYGRTLGNADGSYYYSSASYGGYGAYYPSNAINDTYGSIYYPSDPGSGGGGSSTYYQGGNGGGVIRIEAAEMNLNGKIFSNGGNAVNNSASGSGGSIWLIVNTLKGSGEIQANGGNGETCRGGGGGRIAVYYEDASAFDLSKITAYGGIQITNGHINYNGGAGTIYLKNKSNQRGDLMVYNNNTQTREDIASTPLPAVGQGSNTGLYANKLVSNNASFIPGALIGIKLNPYPMGSTVFTIISNTSTEIFTDPADGNMAETGAVPGSAYIGEHYLYNLTIKGYAKVSTTDRIQVSGTLTVEPGSTLEAENHQ
jgi:hypothetical protein